MGPKELRALPLVIPPLMMQKALAAKLKQAGSLVAREGSASAKLERLFAVLHHWAFTGELTAKWREAHMKELLAEMEAQAEALGVHS